VGTLLDAYGLIALLDDEPAANEVERLLTSREVAMSTVSLAEAAQRMLRFSSVALVELRQAIGALPLSVIPYTEAHAWRAAELRARHYDRRESPVSLADCCLVAVATPADRIATADPAVLRMARAEGVETLALPDSTGERP
jgi:PIN domain nuclease of toxin-antitoxin system